MKMVFLSEEGTAQIVKELSVTIVNHCDCHSCKRNRELLALLTPTEVPEDAVELAMQIYYDCFLMGNGKFEASKAAALIESHSKRVPRAMLEEVYRLGYSAAVEEGKWKISYDTIAEKFHVAIEDVE